MPGSALATEVWPLRMYCCWSLPSSQTSLPSTTPLPHREQSDAVQRNDGPSRADKGDATTTASVEFPPTIPRAAASAGPRHTSPWWDEATVTPISMPPGPAQASHRDTHAQPPASTVQLAPQPSPDLPLPSSHASEADTIPSPQTSWQVGPLNPGLHTQTLASTQEPRPAQGLGFTSPTGVHWGWEQSCPPYPS